MLFFHNKCCFSHYACAEMLQNAKSNGNLIDFWWKYKNGNYFSSERISCAEERQHPMAEAMWWLSTPRKCKRLWAKSTLTPPLFRKQKLHPHLHLCRWRLCGRTATSNGRGNVRNFCWTPKNNCHVISGDQGGWQMEFRKMQVRDRKIEAK